MNTSHQSHLKHSNLTGVIIGTFYEVYNESGHGFLESVYENSLAIALRSKGFEVHQQIAIPVYFRGNLVGDFTADVLVNRCVLLELKSAKTIDPAHVAQLLNYLKTTEIEIGLLLNFGPRPEFKRLAFTRGQKDNSNTPRPLLSSLFDKENQFLSASSAEIRG